jgi:transposase
VYVWSESDFHLEPYSRADGDSTILTLMRLRDRYPKHAIDVVWDGAAYHRSVGVQCAAKKLGIRLHRLPGYSPDFMPVEALWRWLRSEVTANYCHRDPAELIERVANFEHTARRDPDRLRDRLGLPMKLDPAVEKLRCPSR